MRCNVSERSQVHPWRVLSLFPDHITQILGAALGCAHQDIRSAAQILPQKRDDKVHFRQRVLSQSGQGAQHVLAARTIGLVVRLACGMNLAASRQ